MDWYKCRAGEHRVRRQRAAHQASYLTLACLPNADKYLDCPISLIYGERDRLTPASVALGWADFTSKDISVKIVRGANHLFILEKDSVPVFLGYMRDCLFGS
jgi:pimeloyl-ACP methyl ester carboxylesterase